MFKLPPRRVRGQRTLRLHVLVTGVHGVCRLVIASGAESVELALVAVDLDHLAPNDEVHVVVSTFC